MNTEAIETAESSRVSESPSASVSPNASVSPKITQAPGPPRSPWQLFYGLAHTLRGRWYRRRAAPFDRSCRRHARPALRYLYGSPVPASQARGSCEGELTDARRSVRA